MAEVKALGIDVSEFNGNVNVAGIKKDIDFMIIRCGYGSNYADQDDSQYENNVRKCEDQGVPYGVYLYSYAETAQDALSEAEHTLRLLKGKHPAYGVWYDVEDSSLPEGDRLIENCEIYLNKIREAGYYCGIYSNAYWLRTRLNSPRLKDVDKWVAQWGSELSYTENVGMWQFTNSGIIGGELFDMDAAFRDYPRLTEETEGTDLTRNEVIALAREEAQKVYNENEEKYKTIDNVPRWARSAVENVYDELNLTGNGATADGDIQLDASLTYVRALFVMNRILERLDAMAEANEKMLDAAEAIRREARK